MSHTSLAQPSQASQHVHHPISGLDAVNFPARTEGGPQRTDEYTLETLEGFIRPSDELPPVREEATDRSPTSTIVHELTPAEREKGLDIKLVTWRDNDPDDPKNLPQSRKWLVTIAISYTCFAVALGSSLTVMDMPEVAAEFGVSIDLIHLSIAVFVFGFGIGPLLFAPLSEVVGRRPVIVGSMFLYCIFTFPSAFAKNVATLNIGRAIAGFCASSCMTVIGGIISDLFDSAERGKPMALFSGTVFMGPCIGPIIAGFLSAKGWRANYYLLLGISGSAALVAVLVLPETYSVVLLRKRAVRLRKETGDEGYMTSQERFKRPLAQVLRESLIRPLQLLVTEPIIFLFSLYLSLIYALLYGLFFAVPIVFGEIHGFPLGSVGLAFVPIIVGMLSTFVTVLPWQAKHYARVDEECRAQGLASALPEARLPSVKVGAVLLPIGFFIFAWTSYEHVHWIAPMIGTACFGFAMISIYVGANGYIVDSFPEFASSAMAAKTLLSRLCGGAFPMFVDRMYASRLGPRWSSTIFALTACLMLPIPFLFAKWGAKIRGMSKRSGGL